MAFGFTGKDLTCMCKDKRQFHDYQWIFTATLRGRQRRYCYQFSFTDDGSVKPSISFQSGNGLEFFNPSLQVSTTHSSPLSLLFQVILPQFFCLFAVLSLFRGEIDDWWCLKEPFKLLGRFEKLSVAQQGKRPLLHKKNLRQLYY